MPRPQRVAVTGVSHWHSTYDASYLRVLVDLKLDIVGVSDEDATVAQDRADRFESTPFTDYRAMIEETKPEFVVALGRHSLRAQGILEKVLDSLGEERVTLFDKVVPFPSPDLIDTAVRECRAAAADVVVGIGGGSALDLGKAVAILVAHEGTSREYATDVKSIQRRGLPFIAVPTTSGSSSEVVKGSALWDVEAKKSMSLRHEFMFPTVGIVDPELTMTMPPILAANTGMDPFVSSFESYWSTDAQPMTSALHLEAIRLFANNLERSCNEGGIESRSACALGAAVAGMAFSNSRSNICHAIGSPLTLFWNVEHGQSVVVSLPSMLRWNTPTLGDKEQPLWDALGVRDLDEATARIEQMIDNCGLESRLGGLGIGAGDVDTIVDNMRWERLASIPRPMEPDDARAIIQEML